MSVEPQRGPFGIMSNHLNKNLFSPNIERRSCRDGYGDEVVELAKTSKKIVVLDADLEESLRLSEFKKKFPTRFFEMGVSEANMVSVAAGMALEGLIPFTSSFAVFTPNQAVSQIRVSVAYNNANVKMIGSHAGITTGEDGATHQALEDIAIMRSIPNITVLAPADYWQTRRAVKAAAKMQGPVYIRFGRGAVPMVTTENTLFRIGSAQVFRNGTDGTIIAHGESVYRALIAAEVLFREQRIDVAVINMHTIKPLDMKTINAYAKKTRAFVVVEDHQLAGGLGSAIAEYVTQEYPIPMEFVAIRDKFGESGDPEKLVNKYHIDIPAIVEACKKVAKRKRLFWYGK